MSELEIKTVPIQELDPLSSLHPVPIPQPSDELLVTIVDFIIVKLSSLELPPRDPVAVPIPEPHDELIASTSDLSIKRKPIEELDP
jgi:hypothetical protein